MGERDDGSPLGHLRSGAWRVDRRHPGTPANDGLQLAALPPPLNRPLGRIYEEELTMERKIINPWKWQDQFGFVQANWIGSFQRVLVCSGQTAMDAEGRPSHTGDMPAQLNMALDNLETVLREAGFTLADIVRLNYYTTDIDRFFEGYEVVARRLGDARCKPASTLLGVQRLAFPELLVELEATAAQ